VVREEGDDLHPPLAAGIAAVEIFLDDLFDDRTEKAVGGFIDAIPASLNFKPPRE